MVSRCQGKLQSRGRWAGAHRVSGGPAPPPARPGAPSPPSGLPSPQQSDRFSGRDLAARPPAPACAHHASTTQARHPARRAFDSDATGSWAGNVHLSGSLGRGLPVCVSVLERCSARPPRGPCGSQDGTWTHGPHVQLRGQNKALGLRPGSLPETEPAAGGPREKRAPGLKAAKPEGCPADVSASSLEFRLHGAPPSHTLPGAISASSWGKSRRNRLPPASYLP